MNTLNDGILLGIAEDQLATGRGQGAPKNALTFSMVNPNPKTLPTFRNDRGLRPEQIQKLVTEGEPIDASYITIVIQYLTSSSGDQAPYPLVKDLAAAKLIDGEMRDKWEFGRFTGHPFENNAAWAVITNANVRFTLDYLSSISFRLHNIISETDPGRALVRIELENIGGVNDSSRQFYLERKNLGPRILQFYPAPGTTRPGGTATMFSRVNEMPDASIQPGNHPANASVNVVVTDREQEYELRSPGKDAARLTVHACQPDIVSFAVDDKKPDTVAWITSYAESVSLDGVAQSQHSGYATVSGNATMTLCCANALGRVEKTILVTGRENVRRFSKTFTRRNGMTMVELEWEVTGAGQVTPAFADTTWNEIPSQADTAKGKWEGLVACRGQHNLARLDFTVAGARRRVVL